jgi:predicted acylesterase/phospholipase RssA
MLICMTLAAAMPAIAQQPSASPGSAKRPKICLVLSGGGARGAAHVGVIKGARRSTGCRSTASSAPAWAR